MDKVDRELHKAVLTSTVETSAAYLMSRGHSKEDARRLAEYMVETKHKESGSAGNNEEETTETRLTETASDLWDEPYFYI